MCVLRICGKTLDVDGLVSRIQLETCGVHHKGDKSRHPRGGILQCSGFNLVVSDADQDDFDAQINDAIVFLIANRDELKVILSEPGIDETYLDIPIHRRAYFQYDRFPLELLRLLSQLGVELEVSSYPPIAPDQDDPYDGEPFP